MSALPPKADSDHLTGFPQPTKPSPQPDNPPVNRPGMCATRELMPSAGFVLRVREKTCGDVNAKKRSCCGGVSATRCDVHRNCRKNFRPQKQTCTSKDGGYLADAGRTSREEVAESIRSQSRFSSSNNPESTSPKRKISANCPLRIISRIECVPLKLGGPICQC